MKKITDLKDNYLGLRMSDGAGLYISSLVFLYLAQVIVILGASFTNIGQDNLYLQYGIMLINQLVFFMCPILYGKIFSRQMLEPSRIKSGINAKQGLIVTLVAGAAILIGLPLANAFTSLIQKLGYSYSPSLPLATIDKWWTLPLSLFFVGLLPAIGEEFLFRGSIARALKAKSYCFAMIISALMFSIFHGNAMQLLHQFIIGLVTCYCYFVTRSLLSSMIIHFVNNAIALIMGFVMDAVKFPALGMGGTIALYIAMVIVGIFLLVALLRWLARESKKRAGIAVAPISVKAYFVDMGKAFYPKGIKENYKKLNALMKTLYNDPIDAQMEEQIAKEKQDVKTYDDVKDENMRRILMEADKELLAKRRRIDRTALGMAIAIAGLILIINLISGFMK